MSRKPIIFRVRSLRLRFRPIGTSACPHACPPPPPPPQAALSPRRAHQQPRHSTLTILPKIPRCGPCICLLCLGGFKIRRFRLRLTNGVRSRCRPTPPRQGQRRDAGATPPPCRLSPACCPPFRLGGCPERLRQRCEPPEVDAGRGVWIRARQYQGANRHRPVLRVADRRVRHLS